MDGLPDAGCFSYRIVRVSLIHLYEVIVHVGVDVVDELEDEEVQEIDAYFV